MVWIISGITISYLIGSIPTAYIFVRFLKGVDIRQVGSGNVGATNASRILGKPLGITVLLLDIFKGFLVVFFMGNFIVPRVESISGDVIRMLLGLSCIYGHNWTIFLAFKGGKGVATTIGVLLGLAVKISGLMLIFCLVISTWLLVFIVSGIISLSSVIAGISLPIFMILFKKPPALIILSLILSLFIILRHKENLKRLSCGKEPRFNFRKSP